MKDFYKQILQDVAEDLNDEFHENFRRKAFFYKKWKKEKLHNRRGSLMIRSSGGLYSSINHQIGQKSIRWTSSKPYASLQNEGGEITVTRKMQKYFWAMYIREGKTGIEAEQFKAMAMKKVGSKITIPERKFIGDHPEVRKAIESCADITFNEIEKFITDKLKQR